MQPTVIYPDARFKSKMRLAIVLVWLVALAWWAIPVVIVAGVELGSLALGIALAIISNIALLAISFRLVPYYFNSLSYEIYPDEIVVRAGIITKSVKHVPFRTVTNLKVARGPLDRLFGLGSLAVQTAGMSGTTGAEENLEGLTDVHGVYDQIARELRRFRSAMDPTQADADAEPRPLASQNDVLREILDELRGIRAALDQD